MKVNIGKYTDNPKKRKIKIKIHEYDVWSMEHTLALLIVPMLKKLKNVKRGAPIVKDEHVPKNLKAKNSIMITKDHVDENFFKRWDYVLDEMIWAFEAIVSDRTWEIEGEQARKEAVERMENGTKLFGIYYQNLWD